jgi:Fur family peroxide stress response transcriptional regulator
MRRYGKLGIKLTPQRLAILGYLEGNAGHPSAEDIYRSVREQYPTMSQATVYNTLEVLKKKGGVVELTIDPGRKRYDPNTEEHDHLICTGCGSVLDIHREYSLTIPDAESKGFVVKGSHIEFYGLCLECREKGGV